MTKPRNRYVGVYRTPAGAWRWVVELPPDPDGHRRQRSVSVDANGQRFATAKAASEARDAELARMAADELRPATSRDSVEHYLHQWIDGHASVDPASRYDYRVAAKNWIIPTLGQIPLAALSPADIRAWHAALIARGLAISTVRYAHTVLSAALNAAVRDETLRRNVARYVRPPRAVRTLQRFWQPFEAAAFLSAADDDQRYGALWRLALTTAARIGELLALRWTDISFDDATVTIRRTVTRDDAGRKVFGEDAKSDASTRTLPLPAGTIAALKHHRERQRFAPSRAAGRWRDNGLVFPNRLGGRLGETSVRRAFVNTIATVNEDRDEPITVIRLHDMRRTWATIALSNGESLVTIQRQLGHAKLATTELYLGILPDTSRAASDRIEAAFEAAR